jgi:FtsP/CotA-like multicopper oxidase with cupredoxin domain
MAKRRDVLRGGVAALASTPAIFGGSMLPRVAQAQLCRPEGLRTPETEPASPPVSIYTQPLYIPPAMTPVDPASLSPPPNPARHQRFNDFPPVKFYVQHQTEGRWNYHDQLTAITSDGLGSLAWLWNGSTPGDTLVATYGEPVFVRRFNDLPSVEDALIPFGFPTVTTHLHNAHSASESDGNPMDFFESGDFWDHHYAMIYARNDPREALGSLWYHDHMLDFTATNVYAGFSAMSIFYDHIDTGNENDPRETALRLPGGYGQYDLYFILHDVRFGQPDTEFAGHPTYNVFNTDGHLGDVITVNRTAFPYVEVEPRKYRLRFLDGGPSRFYELAFEDGRHFLSIANDGNLLEEPVDTTSLVVGPANRIDTIVDFSGDRGQTVNLVNLMEQVNGQGPTGRRLDPPMPVMQFRVLDVNTVDNSQVPDFLRALPHIDLNEVVTEREWVFDHDMGLWTVNGSFMDPTIISAFPKQGTAEIWRFRNAGATWSHPVHIHFEEAQTLTWNGRPPTGVAKSRKDVWSVGPGDDVRVFYRFSDFLGRFVIHCHNNVHEDNAMMLSWSIRP